MAQTEDTYTQQDTTTVLRSFTFPYINQSDIKVTLDGVATTAYSHPNLTQIQLNSAPPVGTVIRIYRETSDEETQATFYAGSAIRAKDLNDNFTQNLYVIQENNNEVASAWKTGDPTIISTETWAGNDTKIATTGAIDGRIDAKIDTALTNDVSGGDGVTIVDNNPGTGQIRVDLDADIATLKDMQSGAATSLAALTSTELQILDGATLTTTDLNTLDGITATTTELNYTDGVTSSIQTQLNTLSTNKQPKDTELTELATMSAGTASALADLTQTEVQKLDGLTASTAELNKLDGATASTTEINKLQGLTATTTELNKLSGLTATTAELNKLDGVTATTAELNKTDGLLATPVELNTLDGILANTSELNKLDGYTGSTNDLNIVSGKSFKDTSAGTLDTTSDTEIPSSKVIAAHVASSQTAIGGFVTIADEVSFPNTQPLAGVVVSINNAAGLVVSGSGVSTSSKRVDNTTVTINGFPSSLNGETLAAGVGLVVTSTSTANTYNYHKLLLSETDIKNISDEINDFTSRYRIASSAPTSNNDAGDMYFDTSANKMKVYNGTTSSWDDVASVGNFYINTLSGSSGTGGNSSGNFDNNAYRFQLSNAPTMAQQLIVSVNGVIQKPNSGTSQPSEGFAISGNDIIFAAAPPSGSDYFIVTQGSSVSIGTPSDNTVTSAKIVDGSIVNGDISSTANIAGSKVADDSITEVKLDVHNAPATGKYLKYTSNGMEWSDGASEGTDVKSTTNGNEVSTKFLRADGDGTSSWQVPPFIRNDNASTSTGQLNLTAPGHFPLKIANNTYDGKIAFEGSADPYIQYREGTTNKALVGWDSNGYFKINNQEDGSELRIQDDLKFSVDGTTFHSVLTSNSTLDSTKLSPAISAAPEVKLTASEAITAEDSIMVKSNGQAEKITGANSGVHAASGLAYMGGRGGVFDIAYDESADKYVCMYGYGYQGSMRCQIGTPSSNGETITWGSQVEFTAIGYPDWDDQKKDINLIYDPVVQKVYFCYREKENGGKIRHGWVSISGTTPSLYGQQLMHSYSNCECVSCTTNGSNNLMVAYRRSNRPYAVRAYKSTSNLAELGNEWGSQPSAEPHCSNITFGNGGYLYTWADNNNQKKPRGVFVTNNNTGTSNGGSSWSNMTYFQQNASNVGTNNVGPKSAYDPNSNRFVVMWSCPNVALLRACIVEASSSAITIKSYVTISGSGGVSSLDACIPTKHTQYDIEFEPNSGKIIFCYADADDARLRAAKIVNDAFVWDAEVEVHNQDVSGGFRCTIDKDNNLIATIATSFSGGTKDARVYTPPATNLDANRFIGFAKASVSSGAEVTVKVNSNTSTRSGLTPGTVYYVGDTGGLSTTASNAGTIKAGVALSSTKLLIKD